MRALALVALTIALAGCGGGTKNKVTHHQAQIVARLTGKAAQKVGATACKHLPTGTPHTRAALRAYLQSTHPTDDVPAMLAGCESELSG